MATFLVAHGAWSAGWAWKKMRSKLRERGHELWTPTYTGLGERVHLASNDVRLDTHIEDVVKVFEFEDLREVIRAIHRGAIRDGGEEERRRHEQAGGSRPSHARQRPPGAARSRHGGNRLFLGDAMEELVIEKLRVAEHWRGRVLAQHFPELAGGAALRGGIETTGEQLFFKSRAFVPV